MRRKRVLPLAALMLCTPALAGTAPAVAAPQTAPAAEPAAAPAGPLRILLTNDDGYNAPGIRKAFERLTAAGHDVTIVAPLTNQSGTGTKMMSGAPTISVKHPEPKVWAVDGTPGDSVAFGLAAVFAGEAPDLVVSGTNFGPNVAGLATHSGTVGGAVAALESGVPAIALSTGGLSAPDPVTTVNAMGPTLDFAVKLIDRLRVRARSGPLLPKGVGLNVNHPIVGADGKGTAAGVAATFQDPQNFLEPDFTDAGDGTWKVGVKVALKPAAKGGDIEAVAAGKIAVSPMNSDWNTGPADHAVTSALIAGLRP
ncbi:5'/3'-nucleotidase SurE [Streptomyces sp. NRRL F-2580]|uniref:5'/3'-nucleotidase SurE n=1 Tax=Streptomyces sp. NRRL F-2580 TaxID=1463841 RepID=UPI00068F558E|nr:5'/3'-nucleotidase SurE [Streptomyces sp. NRRL F-2580]